ncbi:prepilin-type N-terminal cleavage/methylation domain-containing protein [Gemmatimonas sp.]|uniref:prepilin-type N-terminal cleavage/methylation domain-containing protein n=1 Tax=Gemmatimonas sp. TaxID=1962908 RepID=UPI0025BD6BB1|nr:prepilin-type N-terminal cleavage/methylation domain-containing protein [Gemmatimonas sp.]MCA2990822.1 prepilin-type N-terminal cleavage/methylation domain-containing protein [Gemmatimonas sp.]
MHRARRAGLTLTEVLVAVAIVAIAGALLLSRQVTRRGTQRAASAHDMTAVVDSARTLAMQRRETLRLRVYHDGLWSVEATGARDPIAAGTITAPLLPLDLAIDPRGRCAPSPGWVPREELRAAFDAGDCRWQAPPRTR